MKIEKRALPTSEQMIICLFVGQGMHFSQTTDNCGISNAVWISLKSVKNLETIQCHLNPHGISKKFFRFLVARPELCLWRYHIFFTNTLPQDSPHLQNHKSTPENERLVHLKIPLNCWNFGETSIIFKLPLLGEFQPLIFRGLYSSSNK